MKTHISKTNLNKAYFEARIDELLINGHERLKAKARLAQAEAMADALVAIVNGARRLLRGLVIRPFRRLIASHGEAPN